MKLYISGGISGIDNHIEVFRKAWDELVSKDYEVIDPHDITKCEDNICVGLTNSENRYYHSWECCLRYDLIEMLKCDGLAMLANHWKSEGSKLEVYVASKLKMPIKLVEEW